MNTTKEHTGIMVALFLPPVVAAGLVAMYRDQFDVSASVTPADEMHLTLMYLGDSTDSPYDAGQLYDWLIEWARERAPIKGVLNGLGRFNHTTEDGTPVYLSFDAVELPGFRQSLVEFFLSKGLKIDFNHGFTPHITLAYTPNARDGWNIEVPQQEITFDEITLAFGENRFVVPLGEQVMSSFIVTKGARGEPRWIAVSSSAYLDRDNEIVSMAALEADVARADATKEYGPLLWWHTGVKLGECDYNAMHGRMLVESGSFLSQPIADAVAQKAEGLGLSIGFRHPATEPDTEGVFKTIRRYERSILPRRAASNPYTVLTVKGADMNGEKLAELEGLLGKDMTQKVLAVVETTDKAAEGEGVRHKEKGLLSRLGEWFLGQPEVIEAVKETEDETEEGEEETPEADAGATVIDTPAAAEGEAEPTETKAADEDTDAMPVTRAELKALAAQLRKEMASSSKEVDVSGLATKIEVAAVLGEANAAKEAAAAAQKAADALAGDLPRGVARAFRATKDGATVTEKAGTLAEKAAQSNDPLDVWIDGKFGAGA